jgi:aspartyl-tRNA(Asn)/glutamyl-tRNA(Gln) amidotransferase subunit A
MPELSAPDIRALRFLAPVNYVRSDLDAVVAAAFAAACERLRSAGMIVVDETLPAFERLPALLANGGLAGAEAFAQHRTLLGRAADRYDPQIARRIRRGAAIGPEDYIELQRARRAYIEAFADESVGYDALLWPTVAILPPPLAPLLADDEAYARTNLLVLRNTSAVNVADGCALSLPVPASGGAPVGLMIVARRGEDARLLRIGAELERVLA